MSEINRRGFLTCLAAAAALAYDPERALWMPGKKLISIPKRKPKAGLFSPEANLWAMWATWPLNALSFTVVSEKVIAVWPDALYTPEEMSLARQAANDLNLYQGMQARELLVNPGFREMLSTYPGSS